MLSQDNTTHEIVHGYRRSAFRRLIENRGALFGLVVVLLAILVFIFAEFFAPHDPLKQDLNLRLLPPVWLEGGRLSYFFGTDALGRDIFSRIIYGTRISLVVGVGAVFAGGSIGIFFGIVTGYFGGWIDDVVMRLADVQLSFPALVLTIAIMSVLEPSLINIIIVLSISSWMQFARIVRSQVLSLREMEFIEAERATGAKTSFIMIRHLLPNVLSSAVVVATFAMAQVIIAEASLSFLGIGVPPPTPSWGNMLAEGRNYLASAWWLATFPGLAIMLTLQGINLLGDGLRDILDPRLSSL